MPKVPIRARVDKDPEDVVDIDLDWSSVLGTDTIASAAWSITVMTSDAAAPGATLALGTGPYAPTIVGPQTVRAWLRDGKPGEIYRVSCAVTGTSTPARTIERSVVVVVRHL